MRFILLLRSTFELPQEPVMRQSSTVELLFIFADQCLYVNQSLNSNFSNHKDSFYNLFVNFLKQQSGSCLGYQWRKRNLSDLI